LCLSWRVDEYRREPVWTKISESISPRGVSSGAGSFTGYRWSDLKAESVSKKIALGKREGYKSRRDGYKL
jgi:hypothetical protein